MSGRDGKLSAGGAGHGEAADRYDAIVIGAGPAGEVCAGELADGGLRVAVVEREPFRPSRRPS